MLQQGVDVSIMLLIIEENSGLTGGLKLNPNKASMTS